MANMTIKDHPLMKRSSDIAAMVDYWDTTDTIMEGHKALRDRGKDFLPMFADESKDDFNIRLQNTKFTNVYRDVVEGLASKPFEDEVKLLGDADTVPQWANDFIENVDGAGNHITVFAAQTFFNGINSAIDWIMVDYPEYDTETVRTRADQKAAGLRPFWSHVLGKNVLEVRTAYVGSKEEIVYFRLHEPKTDDHLDRVCVYERQTDGQVTWVKYQHNPEARTPEEMFVQIATGEISIGVIPFVPFATGRRDGNTFKFYPAMQDAADLQITLYRNESGLEFIKTMACYPMLAANGIKPPTDAKGNPMKLAVGPMRVLYGKPDGAGNHGEWAFIEPQANSMEFLQKNIDKTKQDLRELGRQPLTALSTQLTTVTTSIAAGKAKSAVTAWCYMLKDALENALVMTALWMGEEYDPEVHVFTGFDNVLDDGSDLDALAGARERGDLSQETYWSELKRRKVLSPEFNSEKERQRILNEIPSEMLDSPELDDDNDDTQ